MAEYAIGRRAPFVMVPRALIEDPNVDAHTLATYIAIAYFADHGSSDGAFPSDLTASNLARMGERTFRDRRQKLRDLGWLDWESGKQDGTTNRYTLHQTHGQLTVGGSAGDAEGSAGDAEGGRQEMPTTKSQVTKEPIPTDVFERIWGHWEDRRADVLNLNGRRRPMSESKARVNAMRRIWKLGYREDEFMKAINGCMSSDHHVQGGYLDIELICRDQEHFERFLLWGENRRNGSAPDTNQTRDLVSRLYG